MNVFTDFDAQGWPFIDQLPVLGYYANSADPVSAIRRSNRDTCYLGIFSILLIKNIHYDPSLAPSQQQHTWWPLIRTISARTYIVTPH